MSLPKILRASAVAATLALSAFPAVAERSAPGHSLASAHIECNKSILGCYWEYRGPVDEAAAKAYVEDAKRVSDAVMKRFPKVHSLNYIPHRRLLIVEASSGKRLGNFDEHEIEDMFLNAHLAVDEIRFMNHGHHFMLSGRKVLRDFGGGSRYFALRQVRMKGEASPMTTAQAQAQALKTHRPGKPITTVMGDTIISMR
jgi:hypothetical protein